MRAALVMALAGGLVTACGPVPVDRAERECFERARLASGPHGSVAVGATSDGPASKVELDISSDFLQGRDPAMLYDSCVMNRSGQMPRTPLYERPDWKG